MKHFKPDPADLNRNRRAWLSHMLTSARARGEQAGRIRRMRREMARLKPEAAHHGWDGEAGLSTLDMANRAA